MEVFPELNTNRLKLRKISIEDIPSLVRYANNKKITDNILNISYPYHEADAVFRIRYVHEGFRNKSRYVFAITIKESDELIGEVSLHLDKSGNIGQLGYWVGEPFWNKGIATEAAEPIIKFGLERLNLDLVYAECQVENKASEKVLLNNGMIKNRVRGSILRYGLTRQQFKEQRRAAESSDVFCNTETR